jgi:hypothetical protein
LNSQSDSHSLRLTHLEHAINHADCAVSAGFDDVRVGAQRESHVTVRKNLGHVSDRHALREQDGRARMPERMKRQARQVLSAAVLTLLIDNCRMLAVCSRSSGGKWREEGSSFVFTTRDGRPLDGGNVTRDLKRLLVRTWIGIRRKDRVGAEQCWDSDDHVIGQRRRGKCRDPGWTKTPIASIGLLPVRRFVRKQGMSKTIAPRRRLNGRVLH